MVHNHVLNSLFFFRFQSLLLNISNIILLTYHFLHYLLYGRAAFLFASFCMHTALFHDIFTQKRSYVSLTIPCALRFFSLLFAILFRLVFKCERQLHTNARYVIILTHVLLIQKSTFSFHMTQINGKHTLHSASGLF